MEKLRIAVLFGGLSAEHDVSVLTGLQALEALDPTLYEAFPVYIDLQGHWWVGNEPENPLRQRKNYLPDLALKRQLTRVCWPVGSARTQGQWHLQAAEKKLFGQPQTFVVDVVFPVMHGTWGEDGLLQGALQAEGVPLVGGNTGPMAAAMNKLWCQHLAASVGIPTIPSVLVARGAPLDVKALEKALGKYPLFVKPNFLGSSIGVHKVADAAALQAAIHNVLRLDTAALVQPCIANLVEYNVAARRSHTGGVLISAIERPVSTGDSYDFKTKYLSGGGSKKLGGKLGGDKMQELRGLLAATRAINPPELTSGKGVKMAANIGDYATRLFNVLGMHGAPRLDFMVNEKTGELWFNEINPIPGSLSFFLWEAAQGEARSGFTALLTAMINEARAKIKQEYRVADPASSGGGIFTKRGA